MPKQPTDRRRRNQISPLTLERLESRLAPATFQVNTTLDTVAVNLVTGADAAGNVSLRSALMAANSLGGNNTIQLQAGTYKLTLAPSGANGDDSGDLNVSNDLTLVGVRANQTYIDANQLDRAFQIAAGSTVAMSNLEVYGGSIVGLLAQGGGIYNAGDLTLTDFGDGYSNQAQATTVDTGTEVIIGVAQGGMIYNAAGATLSVTRGRIVGYAYGARGVGGAGGADGGTGASGTPGAAGTAGGQAYGGAIFNLGVLTLRDSAVDGLVRGGEGGAGGPGGSGGRGTDGANGGAGGHGGNGAAGGRGGNGGSVGGGGIYVGPGASATIVGGSLDGRADAGGGNEGGWGGDGGSGGQGGSARDASGGDGGQGGDGAASGDGGAGGTASGGGLLSDGGTVTITGSRLGGTVYGGWGSRAGLYSGRGGSGGNGGYATDGGGGDGGGAGRGGDGGDAGPGGDARGGGVSVIGAGSLTLRDSPSVEGRATGGTAYYGGSGGGGGGGSAGGSNVGAVGSPGSGAEGGVGGNGSSSGNALGGALFLGGSSAIITGSYLGDDRPGVHSYAASYTGGVGGDGGDGGFGGGTETGNTGGRGGNGTLAGAAGNGGLAAGGVLFAQSGSVLLDRNTINGGGVFGGMGGDGGYGGRGGNGGGPGGIGGDAGAASTGGVGGGAYGGNVSNAGANVTISNSLVTGGQAVGGVGGLGGPGEYGGSLGGSPSPSGDGGVGGVAAGGGIYNSQGGTLSLTNVTVTGNKVTGGKGGKGGDAVVTGAGDGGASGQALGGGIAVSATSGAVSLTNCTVAGNEAVRGTGGDGGVGPPDGSVGAVSAAEGGGVDVAAGAAAPQVLNTIIAKNTADVAAQDVYGASASLGHNLIGSGTGGSGFANGVDGDQVGTASNPIDPRLGALAENGGPTQSLALLPGSPALDAGSSAGSPADQRGFERFDGLTDIGAFEADYTPPTVSSVALSGPNLTSAATLLFTVTFSEKVIGVTPAAFALTTTGDVAGASIQSVTRVSGSVYQVSVGTGDGDGTLRLDVLANQSFGDPDSNRLAADYTAGPVATIDRTPPAVVSSGPAGAPLSNAAVVAFTVTFSEAVAGVDASAFALTATVAGASVASVTPVSASVYTVAVNTGTGSGTLRLDIKPTNGIADLAGNALLAGGFAGGTAFTLDKTPPSVASSVVGSNSLPADGTVPFTVTFREDVTGVGPASFRLTRTGEIVGAAIVGVTQVSAREYAVRVNTGTGAGTLRLDVAAAGVKDLAGNALAAPFAGGQLFRALAAGANRFLDADGDALTVTLAGPGRVGVVLGGGIQRLVVRGSNAAASSLSVTVTKGRVGNGVANVGTVQGTGLKSLLLAQANLTGGVSLSGPLGRLAVRDLLPGARVQAAGTAAQATVFSARVINDNVAVELGSSVSALTAALVLGGTIKAPSVGAITVAGDFLADLNLTGNGTATRPVALANATVGGRVADSAWQVNGDVGKVTVKGAVSVWFLTAQGSLGTLDLGPVTRGHVTVTRGVGVAAVKGWSMGFLNAASLGRLAVNGDLKTSVFLSGTGVPAGAAVLGTATVTGAVRDSFVRVTGSATAFTAGAFVNSRLLLGYSATDPANPLAGGQFTPGFRLGSFRALGVPGSATPAFVNSVVAAATIGDVTLASAQTGNGGIDFGVIADVSIGSVRVTAPSFQYNPSDPSAQRLGDFVVRVA